MQVSFIWLIKGLSLHSTIVRKWSSYSWKKVESFHSGFEYQWSIEISDDLI